MSVDPKPISPQQLLQLAQALSPSEIRWLQKALDQTLARLTASTKPKYREILKRTFGMWANRDDIPADGVDYVVQIRHTRR
ncbi:MAG: hypothetical protein KDJ65_32660 [Anaerolineae bacterium]|nr:hypothetical protein [Anaerolineae bacterium]